MKPLPETLETLLSQNPIFFSLDPPELSAIAREAIRRTYKKGEFLTIYGDVWPYLFIIESGQVNAVKESSEGRRFTLVSFNPGEIFWGMAFFLDEAVMPVMLEAQQDTIVHLWGRESLLPTLLQHGQVSWEISRELVRRMQFASSIVEELVFLPVAGRLARFLLEHFSGAEEGTVSRDLTLDEMAARIGTTREMVCRLLYRFSESRAIEISRTAFRITDKSKLEAPAKQVK